MRSSSLLRRLPRVISAHAPRVAFGVFHAELAAAVWRVLKRADDRRACRYRPGVNRIGVRDHDVDAAGLDAAELVPVIECRGCTRRPFASRA